MRIWNHLKLRQPCTDTLEELRKDLLEFSHHADRERAVAMLSGLTLYLENHQELLKAKILPSLMATVLDEHTVPQAGPSFRINVLQEVQDGTRCPHHSLIAVHCLEWMVMLPPHLSAHL